MSKHTQGPWFVYEKIKGPMTVGPFENCDVALICFPIVGKGTRKANAQLIAAAPDLLESLKGLHHVCEIALAGEEGQQHVYFKTRLGNFVKASESMRLAEAAIAKAEGERDEQ